MWGTRIYKQDQIIANAIQFIKLNYFHHFIWGVKVKAVRQKYDNKMLVHKWSIVELRPDFTVGKMVRHMGAALQCWTSVSKYFVKQMKLLIYFDSELLLISR